MKTLKARFAGKCFECGMAFPAGETILWNGHAWHPACHAELLEKERREQAEETERQLAWMAERKAGKHIKTRATAEELIVEGAPNYAMARAEAFAFVCSVQAAGGKAWLLKKRRGGKTYLGREIVTYYGGSNLGYHEGWAFRYRVEQP